MARDCGLRCVFRCASNTNPNVDAYGYADINPHAHTYAHPGVAHT